MDTNNPVDSRKRNSSLICDGNDGSAEDGLESTKAKNARLNEELDARNAANLFVLDTPMKSSPSNDDDIEAEIDRLKEVEASLQSQLYKTQTEMAQLKYEREIEKLKLVINARDKEVNELKEQLSDTNATNNRLTATNIAAELLLVSGREAFIEKLTDMLTDMENLTKKNAKLEIAKHNAEEAGANYHRIFDAMNTDRQMVLDANKECEKKIKALEDQLQALKDEIDLRDNDEKPDEKNAIKNNIDLQP